MNKAAELVGMSGKPFTMPIELGKVTEFMRATTMSTPQGVSVAPGATIPPTFLQTAILWDVPGSNPVYENGLDFKRLLHGEQEFTITGAPPRVGDTLIVQRRIDKVYEKSGKRGGGMTFIEEVVEFRSESGQVVAEGRSTRILTSTSTTEGPGTTND